MTITLELQPETQRKLETLATKNGQDVPEYLGYLIDQTVRDKSAPTLPVERTFDEILAPFRQGFDESGMNEEETTTLFDEELKAVRAERKAKRNLHG